MATKNRIGRGPGLQKFDQEKITSLQIAGQKAFKAGEFQSALESFTQALAENKDDIGLLDNRSATYCKLRQYSLARNDARAMVKLAPTDERGYLRLGQVLRLDGSPEKAVAIYEYALQKLPENNRSREALNQLLKKVQDQLAGGNRRDPFTILPLELAVWTLESFSFKQIVGILRVCKGWNRFLKGIPSLWMDLDLTGARKRVPWTAVRTYIHQSKVALTRANIHEIAAAATLKVLDMLSRCPHLEHLEMHIPHDNPPEFYAKIKTFKRLKTLVCTDVKISHGCVGGILSDLPLLEKATFGNIWESWQSRENGDLAWPKHLPNLKSLTIGCSHRDPSRPLIPFSLSNVIPRLGSISEPTYPNLEELHIVWDPPRSNSFKFITLRPEETLPPLRTLELRGAIVQPDFYAKLPKSLKTLRFYAGSVHHVHPGHRHSMEIAENELPCLTDLIFDNTPWVNLNNLALLLWNTKAPIQTLHLNYCHNVTGEDLINNFIEDPMDINPALRKMTNLGVAGIAGIDDTTVKQICTALPDLKILDLSETRITGCTIRMVAEAKNDDSAMAKLDGLVIKRCDGVDPDAIEYGRSMGLLILN